MQPEEKHSVEPAHLSLVEGTGNARRPSRRLVVVILTALSMMIMGAISLAAAVQFYVILPGQTYDLMAEDPFWSKLDVENMRFKAEKDFADAEFYLNSAASKGRHKDSPLPHFLLGKLYQIQSRNPEAIAQLEQARQDINGSWYNRTAYREYTDDLNGRLAILYYENNKETEARAAVGRVSDAWNTAAPELVGALANRLEDPDRADYRINLAEAFRHHLKIAHARTELQAALSLSKDPMTRNEIKTQLSTQFPQHLKDLTPMVRYYSLAGQKLESDNELRQAADFYEIAVRQNPMFEWGYNELAIIYRRMQDYKRAARYANEALRLNPHYYNPYLTLGDIALDQDNYKEAIAHFSKAQEIIALYPDPDSVATDANIDNQLGFAYEQMEDIIMAEAHYRKAMKKSSEGVDNGCDCLNAEYEYAESALNRLAEQEHRITRNRSLTRAE